MSDPNLIWGIDDGEQVRQDVNKVTEEAIQRVQANSKQARQIQAQIKQSKAENNNIAKFLQFLLSKIKNEELISAIYKTFFMVVDTRTNTTYYRKQINNTVIIWFFVPFFVKEANEFWLWQLFNDILPKNPYLLDDYVDYIRKLSKKHHDNIPIKKDELIKFLALVLLEFNVKIWHSEWMETIEDKTKWLINKLW